MSYSKANLFPNIKRPHNFPIIGKFKSHFNNLIEIIEIIKQFENFEEKKNSYYHTRILLKNIFVCINNGNVFCIGKKIIIASNML